MTIDLPDTSFIAAQLGAGGILSGDDVPDRFRHDWSGLAPLKPLTVFRPTSSTEVATVLRWCAANDVPLVPQGGLTGLAGGAHPIANGAVLTLERMTGIEEIDPVTATMTVKAGTTLAAAQEAAEATGLMLALDLGARGSCTIGGVVSTNAGGNRVIRYGMARAHVLGLEVVLADGTIVSALNRLVKNNAGYDLKQLFIGAEGTLGIITRAVLHLQPRPRAVATAFCAADDFDGILALFQRARGRFGPALTSFEVMWPSFYDFMLDNLTEARRAFPERHGAYALIELASFDDENSGSTIEGRLEAGLSVLLDEGVIADAVLAKSQKEAADLWAIREGVSEYGRFLGPLTAFDIGLVLTAAGAFVCEVEAAIAARWPGAVALSYGHVGDSNLHLVVHVPSAGARQPQDELSALVYSAVQRFGGTISAEHGIGLLKKPYLGFTRSAEEMALMRRLKQVLDPQGILNPGKVFDMA